MKKPKTIIITGPESSGKSTLVNQLKHELNATVYNEYARDYIQNLNRNYTFQDIEHIAKQQISELKEAEKAKTEYVLFDTSLAITKVWFEVVYKKTPFWFEEEISNFSADLILLLKPDLPWIEDKVRENGSSESRILLFNRYKEIYSELNCLIKIIEGKEHFRTKMAIDYIQQLNK